MLPLDPISRYDHFATNLRTPDENSADVLCYGALVCKPHELLGKRNVTKPHVARLPGERPKANHAARGSREYELLRDAFGYDKHRTASPKWRLSQRHFEVSFPLSADDFDMKITAIVLLASAISFGTESIPARADEPLVRISRTANVVERVSDASIMLTTINAERASRRLAPLSTDPDLRALALAHAEDMGKRGYFGHQTPEGLNPFQRMDIAHYAYSYAGENVALDENVGDADNAFWKSDGHRANILETHFGRVGLAVVAVTDGELFVEEFSN